MFAISLEHLHNVLPPLIKPCGYAKERAHSKRGNLESELWSSYICSFCQEIKLAWCLGERVPRHNDATSFRGKNGKENLL